MYIFLFSPELTTLVLIYMYEGRILGAYLHVLKTDELLANLNGTRG